MHRILIVQHAANLTGSAISGRLLAAGFRRAGWRVDVAFSDQGDAVGQFAELGCDVHFIPHGNWLSGGDRLRSIRKIGRELLRSRDFAALIRACRPDVVYVNSLVSLGGAAAALRTGVPCVWHLRELFDDVGGEVHIPPLGGKSLVRATVRKCASHAIVISDAVRENVLGRAYQGPLSVVPNAVDESFFELAAGREECRSLLGLPAGATIIGVPGTLRPMKGHEFFLEAAAALAKQGQDFRIAITGDGEPRFVEKLHDHTRQLGLASRTHFLGSIRRMPEFYRACDAVCVPSRAEPFGRTVIEAFAVGVPIVASAVGGIRETIDDGRTGLLVEYGAVSRLAQALIRLLTDRDLGRTLAATARETALQRYTADAYQRRLVTIVEDSLKCKPIATS